MDQQQTTEEILRIVTRLEKIIPRISNIEATQDQVLNRLESIETRLSKLELHTAKIEKFVGSDNAYFDAKQAV